MAWFFGKWQESRRKREALRRAYEGGKEEGSRAASLVSAWLDSRLPEVSTNLLDGFRQRLTTINDSPPHPPADVAKVELSIFLDHVRTNFQARLQAEAQETLHDVLAAADTIGARPEIEQAINLRLSEALTDLVLRATLEAGSAIEGLGQTASSDADQLTRERPIGD